MQKIINTGGRVEKYTVRVKDPKKVRFYEALGYEITKIIRIKKRNKKRKKRRDEKWKG